MTNDQLVLKAFELSSCNCQVGTETACLLFENSRTICHCMGLFLSFSLCLQQRKATLQCDIFERQAFWPIEALFRC